MPLASQCIGLENYSVGVSPEKPFVRWQHAVVALGVQMHIIAIPMGTKTNQEMHLYVL